MPNWSGGATGAASGAAAGAVFGPWGAAAGGLIGGGLGLFGGGDAEPPPPVNLPYFEEDRARLGGLLRGQSPFAGSEWGGLVSQLQARASGTGPSVAGNAYKQASQDAFNNLTSLSRNSASPAGARQALLQQGHIQQGLAQGFASARDQEMMGAAGQLAGALGARDQLNQGAYLNVLGQQLGLSQAQQGALQGNQQVALQQQQLQNQQNAAMYQSISNAALGAATLRQNRNAVQPNLDDEFRRLYNRRNSGGPVTSPSQVA